MSQVVLEPDAIDAGAGNGGWVVVIFNNDITPMDVVVEVLMRATNCDVEEAYIEMWEAHHYGKANVHYAGEEECRKAASTIDAVGVQTEVKKEWDD